MINQVIYFSLNKRTEAVFCEFVEQKRFCFKDAFRLLRTHAQHVSDLFEVLDSQEDVSRLFVIVDYISFYWVTDATRPDSRNGSYDLPITAAKQIRRAILKYPEVNFLFEESGLPHHVDFTSFLFPDANLREDVDKVYIQYHQFNNANPEPFLALLNGENNLYDGTNLRNAVKRYLYRDLKCSRRNFSLLQDSRRDHLAICVEEEISQNRFNSYVAYSNGFRVLPVITSNELQEINNVTRAGIINPSIVIRDYDLQFSDVIQKTEGNRLRRVIDKDTLTVLNKSEHQTSYKIGEQDYSRIQNRWYEIIPVNNKIKRLIKEGEESIINEFREAESLSITMYEKQQNNENETSSRKIDIKKINNQWLEINKKEVSITQESLIWNSFTNQNYDPINVIINSYNQTSEYLREKGKWYEYVSINEIDRIRGTKHNDKRGVWYALSEKELIPYWDGLANNYKRRVYFVSKGGPKIVTTASKFKMERALSCEESNIPYSSDDAIFLDGVGNQVVRGLEKPVSGLYLPFHSFKEYKENYLSFAESELFVKNYALKLVKQCRSFKDKIILYKYLKEDVFFKTHFISSLKMALAVFCSKLDKNTDSSSIIEDVIKTDKHRKEQEWVIKTDRENHNHGVPLDLYDLAKSMISRASNYYKDDRFIKAAVISSEVIEVLNGFHEALMLEAYHILAISENAIAMNTIGGSELALANDAKFRIRKIEHDVDRMLARGLKDRRDLKYNILNQIYIDCRTLCQSKEHFLAEDCFISAMAHVNEGFTPCDIWHEVISIGKRVWNKWEAYKSEHSYGRN